jgi:hypothetical protein
MNTKDMLSHDLRLKILELQHRLITLSDQLEVDPTNAAVKWIEENYRVADDKLVKGRAHYKHWYKRTERRDLAQGKFVVQKTGNQVILSKGMLDKARKFTDAVRRLAIQSEDVLADVQKIKAALKN